MTKERLMQEHHMIQKGLSVGKAQSHADLSTKYAEQTAIAFAEWIAEQTWTNYADGVRLWRMKHSNAPVNTPQLYQLFLQSSK